MLTSLKLAHIKAVSQLKLGLDARKPVFQGSRTTKVQLFVIHILERIIPKLATGEFSIFS